ncbi:MAG: 3-keto-5-aminohexanoate cleavage protein [Woeseiaceae bacterium]|nr:3-keto-5-aminohexanoate cleavage protein [Woeseiaceae bacterium]
MSLHAWRRFSADRVIVMAAPNGARRTRADHPALPLTPEEQAADAVCLKEAGASVLHLHVRDEEGGHTLEPDRYREAIAAIRAAVGDELILQITTEAVGRYGPAEQMQVVEAVQPEAVSVALREILPAGADEAPVARFFAGLAARGCWPQVILYSAADAQRFDELRQRGVFGDPAPFALFVLGSYAAATPGRVADLEAILGAVDASEFPWAVCCFGREELTVMRFASEQGGHVRIGFENNLEFPDGSRAPDNASLVRRFARGIAGTGRGLATAAEIRSALLGIS